MAISRETQEGLKEIQQVVAEVDPSILDLDPASEEDATTIALLGALFAAMRDGGSLSIVAEREDGRSETIAISAGGYNSDGQPLMRAQFRSNDGLLSPEIADVAANLLAVDHQAEINKLIGE